MIGDLPENKKIVLFDGVCNLCNQTVNCIIAHDKKDIFRFVALDSVMGKAILNHLRIDVANTESVILYDPGKAYYLKSDSVIEIARNLSGLPAMLTVFQIFPRRLRDELYDFISRNRYRWFGKKNDCLLPSENTLRKFIK